MKKVLIAALAAVALVTGFTTAKAQATAAHWVFDQVKFRSHQAVQTDPLAFSDIGVNDAVDSLYASGIAKFDTTAAIPTAGWSVLATSGSATDSTCYAKVFIYDAGLASATLGKTSTTAESIYIKVQVSASGNTASAAWHDCAVIAGQAPVLNAFTVQTTVNAAVVTFVSSTNTGIADKLWSMELVSTNTSAALKSAQDINHAWQFPYIRFIIMGSRSLNHSYKCQIAHGSTQSQKQPG